MPKLIDANVIIRYLVRDVADLSARAKQAIREGAFTTPEVLAEVVYVLGRLYRVERADIARSIGSLLLEVAIEHPQVYHRALAIYAAKNLDFVDCILIARHQVLGDEIFSFDRKLNNNLEVNHGFL